MRYSIVSHSPQFFIDPSTGAVSVDTSLDRETSTEHTVLVEVMNTGEESINNTLVVV